MSDEFVCGKQNPNYKVKVLGNGPHFFLIATYCYNGIETIFVAAALFMAGSIVREHCIIHVKWYPLLLPLSSCSCVTQTAVDVRVNFAITDYLLSIRCLLGDIYFAATLSVGNKAEKYKECIGLYW